MHLGVDIIDVIVRPVGAHGRLKGLVHLPLHGVEVRRPLLEGAQGSATAGGSRFSTGTK